MTATNDDRTDEALIALRRILRATELHERELAQSVGLTPAKLRILQLLSSQPLDGMIPTALANRMGVSQATITALVDKLEQLGYAARRRSATDRRQTNVLITDAGNDALKSAPNALQQQFAQGFAELADWEQAALVSNLQRAAAMLNAGSIDASPVLATGDIKRPPRKS